MIKVNAFSLSIFCLSIALIISAVIVANGIKENGYHTEIGLSKLPSGLTDLGSNTSANTESVVYVRNTYNLPAASAYLGISESQLMSLIDSKDSGIPYIKIGNEYLFSKHALDKWLETARVEIK